MDDQTDVGSPPVPEALVEGWMLREGRLARGEQFTTIARELGIDKRTISRWRQQGAWRPRARASPRRPSMLTGRSQNAASRVLSTTIRSTSEQVFRKLRQKYSRICTDAEVEDLSDPTRTLEIYSTWF